MRSERGWLLLAGTTEVAVAVGAVACPTVSLRGLLIGGPLLAAHRLSVRATVALAAAAALLAAALPGTGDAVAPWGVAPDYAVSVLFVAAVGLWAVLLAHTRTSCEAALARMTRIAELAQRAHVRPLPAEIGGLAVAVHTSSATEDALLGGDLYDVTLTAAGPRLVLGDARGHGVDAARVGAAVVCAFRQTAATEPDLVRLARTLDLRIQADLGDEDFVTLLLADFVPGEVRMVNCGHPPPLRTGRRLEVLEPPDPSPPLGLSPRPCLQRITLGPQQRMLFYTDGLTEARDARGVMFPLDHQVKAALSAPPIDQALDGLLDLLHQHAARDADDDLTLLLVQPTVGLLDGAPGPAPENEGRQPPLRSP
ncbi:PP2C family protein-serine/threonine phosphatase [Streptomyces atriruber]|uniref:PP2C family protein-serine/threonine phosphatase n=1 Tax=Streptomyces atriruber TaxID=545121 RepID=UPI000AAF4E63|nr:PP2C family protein-serine/threonine phosphatase [Streptomyces atriruber]